MDINTLHTIYFVEEMNIVSLERGVLDFLTYQQTMHKTELFKILREDGLEEHHDFIDMIRFNNSRCEIVVDLKSEDSFYDDEHKAHETTLNEYVTQVNFISLKIIKPLKKQDREMIEKIMLKFKLNIYHINTKKHCTDIMAVETLLRELNLIEI